MDRLRDPAALGGVDRPTTAKRTSTLAGPSCNVLSTLSVECSNRMGIADRHVDDAGRERQASAASARPGDRKMFDPRWFPQ
jgi:hypothetical protein